MCICHTFFICLSVNGHLGCLHVLAIINSAAVNIELHVSLEISFLWIYTQEWDCWITWQLFFLRNPHTVFHTCYTNVYPHQHCRRAPFLHNPSSIYYLYTFLMKAILTSVRGCLIIVLICISLIISNVEHLCMSLLIICVSFGEMFTSSTHFLIQLVSIVVTE